MKYRVELLKGDKFVTVWNFKTETVFLGCSEESTARLKANAKIGFWKIKKLK